MTREMILNRPTTFPKFRARHMRLKTVRTMPMVWRAQNKMGTYLGYNGQLTKDVFNALVLPSRSEMRKALLAFREANNSIL